jgi:hypothetical protein
MCFIPQLLLLPMLLAESPLWRLVRCVPGCISGNPLGETFHWVMKPFLRQGYIAVREKRAVQKNKGALYSE